MELSMYMKKGYKVDQEAGTVKYNGILVARFEETQGRNPIECTILGDTVYCVNIDDMLDHIDECLEQDF